MNFRVVESRARTSLRKPRTVAIALAVIALQVLTPAIRADAETKYTIDRQVWGGYQKYLGAIGSTRPGAFAITTDGSNYYYYISCKALRCTGSTTYSHDAKQACEQEYNTDCLVFAVRRDIRVQYQIRQN